MTKLRSHTTLKKVLELAGQIALRHRLELLDDPLDTQPEHAEPNAPRALLDC